MSDSSAFAVSASRSTRLVARHLTQGGACADVTALVRATLEDLRRSESALEVQLSDLRHYLGLAGVTSRAAPSSPACLF
ncbi:MAG: hypothetical protein K2X62_05530 [Beijerinckiaceae bacterium]|nr:hypothetical protein [Beijerinckiaceae bacterium]